MKGTDVSVQVGCTWICGILGHIYYENQPNVGEYTIHGCY